MVTGVLDGGRLHLGDLVDVFPSGARGRVQGMQRRNQAVASAEPGGRLALALNGITVKAVPRGSVVGLPGAARPSSQLDCLLQAREYQEQGHANVQPWIDTSIAALATPSAKQIAHEAITQNSLSWLERAKQAAAGDD